MIGALLACLVATPPPALAVDQRIPLRLVVENATGVAVELSVSELVRLADGALRDVLAVEVQPADPGGAARCGASVECRAEAVRGKEPVPVLLLLVEARPDGARLGALVVRPEGEIVDAPRALELAGPDLPGRFATWIRSVVHPAVPELGIASAWSSAMVYGIDLPVTVVVDGAVIGAAEGPSVELTGLRPGPHVVELVAADGQRSAHDVVAAWGARPAVMMRRLDRAAPPSAEVARWTGIGAIAAGGAMVVGGLVARAAKERPESCERNPGTCGVAPFPTTSAIGLGAVAGGVPMLVLPALDDGFAGWPALLVGATVGVASSVALVLATRP